MSKNDDGSYVSDLRGLSKLVIDATTGVTDIVESMHLTIQRASLPVGKGPEGRTQGITGLVYETVRSVQGVVGSSIDLVLTQLAPLMEQQPDAPERVYAQGALNAVVGDHLEASQNPLAVRMRLTHEGRSLTLTPEALASVLPEASGKIVVFIHGLAMNDLWWQSLRPNYAADLQREQGFTPLQLRYNTGRHISFNGQQLAEQLDALVAGWPVPIEQLVLVGYSMGGLVARSAVHYAGQGPGTFRERLTRLVFLASPHHGAPLERGGNWLEFLGAVSPYSAPIFRVARLRSAGITDLRYGNLLDEDWNDRDRFARSGDCRKPVPLPDGVPCHALAGKLAASGAHPVSGLVGDGMVPLDSALGHHPNPERDLGLGGSDARVIEGLDHLGILNHPDVYRVLADWLAS